MGTMAPISVPVAFSSVNAALQENDWLPYNKDFVKLGIAIEHKGNKAVAGGTVSVGYDLTQKSADGKVQQLVKGVWFRYDGPKAGDVRWIQASQINLTVLLKKANGDGFDEYEPKIARTDSNGNTYTTNDGKYYVDGSPKSPFYFDPAFPDASTGGIVPGKVSWGYDGPMPDVKSFATDLLKWGKDNNVNLTGRPYGFIVSEFFETLGVLLNNAWKASDGPNVPRSFSFCLFLLDGNDGEYPYQREGDDRRVSSGPMGQNRLPHYAGTPDGQCAA